MGWTIPVGKSTDRLERDVRIREWRLSTICGDDPIYLLTTHEVEQLKRIDPDMALLDLYGILTTPCKIYMSDIVKGVRPHEMVAGGVSTPIALCVVWAIIDANREASACNSES